jgi:hypothetical protein
LLDIEVRRLTNVGYSGDIIDKMYKSARYYFRKKNPEKKEPKKRCEYISISRDLLILMDDHIKTSLKDSEYKPSDGFLDFCKMNKDNLKEEISILLKQGIKDSEEIKNKIKKTYKNRYFTTITK